MQAHRALLLATVLSATGAAAASADDEATTVLAPERCMQFWYVPGGATSPVAWDHVLSFAACIQDASVGCVDTAAELEPFVETLQTALEPSILLQIAAIERGPERLRLRAAYQLGSGLLSLIIRARASIACAPDRAELSSRLESLLEPHARLAWLMFTTIGRAAALEPDSVADVVTRNIVRSARQHAAVLEQTWRLSPEAEQQPLLAAPH